MNSRQTNVRDIADGFVQRYRATLESIISDLKTAHGERRDWLDGRSDPDLEETAGRLIAFDNARSMLDIARVLPRDRVFRNPLEPVRLAAVMLLKRDPGDPMVLNHARLEPFIGR